MSKKEFFRGKTLLYVKRIMLFCSSIIISVYAENKDHKET